ncbi:MAG: hypothetical protein DMG00_19150 [Acidobacteria bacterium]|nr:MAG: hypothetical protein DMG00_19150 [Acidobacteriota bacterium]
MLSGSVTIFVLDQLSAISYQLSAISYQLSAITQLSTVRYQSAPRYQLLALNPRRRWRSCRRSVLSGSVTIFVLDQLSAISYQLSACAGSPKGKRAET